MILWYCLNSSSYSFIVGPELIYRFFRFFWKCVHRDSFTYVRTIPTKHLDIIREIRSTYLWESKEPQKTVYENLDSLRTTANLWMFSPYASFTVLKNVAKIKYVKISHDKVPAWTVWRFFLPIREQDVVARPAPSMSLIWTHQIGNPLSARPAVKAWHVRWCPPWQPSRPAAVRMVKTLLQHFWKESQCNDSKTCKEWKLSYE